MKKTILLTLVFPMLLGCSKPLSNAELFENTVKDVLYADESKIRPLVNLTPGDDNVIFNKDNTKVLLCSLHHYPDSYKEGETITTNWESWLVSVKEMANWYKKNKGKFTDYVLRSKQLLGVAEEKAHTHISSFYVNVSDLIRPVYETDVTKPMRLSLPSDVSEDYKKWFNDNIIYSYYNEGTKSPWTRLGYTYDWSGTSDCYGLSEFLLPSGKEITTEKTVEIKEFFTDYLENIK
ncbi:MAG: hypothetical protein MJ213_01295 [Bacilli bacterium]|nr:hypothetical protein [Bacilli bacterium]